MVRSECNGLPASVTIDLAPMTLRQDECAAAGNRLDAFGSNEFADRRSHRRWTDAEFAHQ